MFRSLRISHACWISIPSLGEPRPEQEWSNGTEFSGYSDFPEFSANLARYTQIFGKKFRKMSVPAQNIRNFWSNGKRPRSAPCSTWLICQIIKVEWTNQKKTGNNPLGQCSFNREAVKTQFSCPLRKIHKISIVQLKCYGAHFISKNKAAKKFFKIILILEV